MVTFEEIINLVDKGFTVRECCKKLNMNSRYIYRYLTDAQKRELKEKSLLGKKKSVRRGSCPIGYNASAINGFEKYD